MNGLAIMHGLILMSDDFYACYDASLKMNRNYGLLFWTCNVYGLLDCCFEHVMVCENMFDECLMLHDT